MELFTGKNKTRFEEWLISQGYYTNNKNILAWVYFDKLPFEMQIGVILAYYDSLGLWVNTWKEHGWEFEIERIDENKIELKWEEGKNFTTRNEAYKQAFIKADEIINKTL